MQYLWTSKYRLSITDFIFNSIWTIFNHVQLQEVHEDDHKRKSRAKKNDTKSKFRSKSEERAKSGPASLTQNVVFQEDIASPSSHSAFSETSVWSYLLCIICLLHFDWSNSVLLSVIPLILLVGLDFLLFFFLVLLIDECAYYKLMICIYMHYCYKRMYLLF